MYSRQIEQLARQRQGELRTMSQASRTAAAKRALRKPIRSHTGWALVALGLRIAESGSR